MSAGHDRGAVLIKDGKVLIGITQARLSRIKSDGGKHRTGGEGLPLMSIDYCLSHYGLNYNDVDLYVYSSTESFTGMEDQFEFHLKLPISKLKFIPHHLAHAFSSFFSSGFKESLVVVADAMGNLVHEVKPIGRRTEDWYPNLDLPQLGENEDWGESVSIYHFTLDGYKEIFKKWQKFPHPWESGEQGSLGTIYGNAARQLIYDEKSNEWPAGKLMGLASYADPNFISNHLLRTSEIDGDINLPLISFYPEVDHRNDFMTKANVAGLYQREQETSSLILARMAKKLHNSENICVAGGSFLNCNSNEIILKSKLFNNCYFVPPADDSGIPLGCAWYGSFLLGDLENTKFLSPYFGKTYSKSEVLYSLSKFPNCSYTYYDNFDELTETVAQKLSENCVIGWMQGGSEIGPRALGNRSIIASPISSWMEKNVNHLKGREWYRPFAPAVLFEKQSEIFDLSEYSPYMLVTSKVNENWRFRIPAVTHIDGTSRFQSVTKESNSKFYTLISKFYERTGIPVILNTSFNGANEPIVESPYDALNTFVNNKLDFLVVGNFLIKRND